MPGDIQVSVNKQQRRELEEALEGIPKGVPTAIAAAINRTLQTGRTRIRRRISEHVNLKASLILSALSLKKANRQTQEGAVRISRKGIPLIEFGAVETRLQGGGVSIRRTRHGDEISLSKRAKGGVSVTVNKEKGRELHPHYFIATMPTGHVGVFDRRKVGGKRAGRLPIDQKYGPSVLGVFEGAPGVAAEVLAGLGEDLQKNLDSQVDRLLQRKRADRPE